MITTRLILQLNFLLYLGASTFIWDIYLGTVQILNSKQLLSLRIKADRIKVAFVQGKEKNPGKNTTSIVLSHSTNQEGSFSEEEDYSGGESFRLGLMYEMSRYFLFYPSSFTEDKNNALSKEMSMKCGFPIGYYC
ncbi:hypothetical protein HNY73_006231 [Argiope bruennichi]|uniref:Uncharacterized protein n=1 Tax=Argiope bruennichi TaxID=94029 RepID=A0A8T0FJB2_ARGBR|nr:hypothetical protein HNY73_006231 [Argiope bruennichi]